MTISGPAVARNALGARHFRDEPGSAAGQECVAPLGRGFTGDLRVRQRRRPRPVRWDPVGASAKARAIHGLIHI